MADLVDTVREEIGERLKKLAPMMVEFERLSAGRLGPWRAGIEQGR